MSSDLKVLMQAASIIQRDAVVAALKDADINCVAETRDISRKIADSTVDLAYEGYSALFDGFTIEVHEADFTRAKEVADRLLQKADDTVSDPGLTEGSSMRKFYFCCLFSMTIPLIFHGLALYHLTRGVLQGEKIHPVYATMSAIVFLVTAAVSIYLIYATDLMEAVRSFAEML